MQKSIRRYRDSTISISKNKQEYSCLFLKTLNFHAYSNVEVDEPGEGVLVHGVYGGQVGDCEEENTAVFGYRSVPVTDLVYPGLRLHGRLLFQRYLL